MVDVVVVVVVVVEEEEKKTQQLSWAYRNSLIKGKGRGLV